MNTCRSCGAPIRWADTEKGKKVPLNAKPEKRFILVQAAGQDPAGEEVNNPVAIMEDTYLSHYATCPDADKWRKKTPSKEGA